jgi:hypothetical protein
VNQLICLCAKGKRIANSLTDLYYFVAAVALGANYQVVLSDDGAGEPAVECGSSGEKQMSPCRIDLGVGIWSVAA